MRTRFAKYLAAVPGACLAAALLVMCGCSASADVSQQAGMQVEDAASVQLANATGKDIEALRLKESGSKEYGDNIALGGLLEDGAACALAYPQGAECTFDLEVTTNDGSIYELSGLKLSDMEQATLKLSSSGLSSYLEYTSASSGQACCVMESEQLASDEIAARKKAQKQAAKAEKKAKAAEKKADELEKAAEQAERAEAQAASEEASSSGPSGSSSSSSSGSSSSSSSKKSSSSSSSSSKKSSEQKSSQGSGSDDGQDNRCIEL